MRILIYDNLMLRCHTVWLWITDRNANSAEFIIYRVCSFSRLHDYLDQSRCLMGSLGALVAVLQVSSTSHTLFPVTWMRPHSTDTYFKSVLYFPSPLRTTDVNVKMQNSQWINIAHVPDNVDESRCLMGSPSALVVLLSTLTAAASQFYISNPFYAPWVGCIYWWDHKHISEVDFSSTAQAVLL